MCFSVNLMKFLKTHFLWNTSSCGFYFLRTAIFCFDILYFGDFLSQLLNVMNIMSLSDQGIWNKMEEFRNIGQGEKGFISISAWFLTAAAKVKFLEGGLAFVSNQIWNFSSISWFPKMWGNSRGNSSAKFAVVDIKFRFTCGESDLY